MPLSGDLAPLLTIVGCRRRATAGTDLLVPPASLGGDGRLSHTGFVPSFEPSSLTLP